MNTRRKLIVLVKVFDQQLSELLSSESGLPKGYDLIHCLTGVNDEPPYISCSYWGTGRSRDIYEEDGECASHYLIRSTQTANFISTMNACESDRLDGVYQYTIERSYEPESFSGVDIHDVARREAYFRAPRIKKFLYSNFTFPL